MNKTMKNPDPFAPFTDAELSELDFETKAPSLYRAAGPASAV